MASACATVVGSTPQLQNLCWSRVLGIHRMVDGSRALGRRGCGSAQSRLVMRAARLDAALAESMQQNYLDGRGCYVESARDLNVCWSIDDQTLVVLCLFR